MNRALKRHRTMGDSRPTVMDDIPGEIIAEILTRCVKNSPADYANATIASKAAWEVSKRFPVFKNVDLAEVPPVPWRRVEEELVKRCAKDGNIEALFRIGLNTFFRSSVKAEVALCYLRKALDGGHLPAGYMLGIILVYCFGVCRGEEGIKILSSLKLEKKADPRNEIWSCRKRGADVLRCLWGWLPFLEPVVEAECERCKGCKVHEITKEKGVSCPKPGRWYKPEFETLPHPETWQFHIHSPDPLDGVSCSRCYWIKEAIFFFSFIRAKCFSEDETVFI